MGQLIFDGDCAFCSSSARWLTARFAPGGSCAPWQRMDLRSAGLSEADVASQVWWIDEGSKVGGADAIARALQSCRGPWPAVGRMLGSALVVPFARPLYRLIARHRHRLPGGTAACRLDL